MKRGPRSAGDGLEAERIGRESWSHDDDDSDAVARAARERKRTRAGNTTPHSEAHTPIRAPRRRIGPLTSGNVERLCFRYHSRYTLNQPVPARASQGVPRRAKACHDAPPTNLGCSRHETYEHSLAGGVCASTALRQRRGGVGTGGTATAAAQPPARGGRGRAGRRSLGNSQTRARDTGTGSPLPSGRIVTMRPYSGASRAAANTMTVSGQSSDQDRLGFLNVEPPRVTDAAVVLHACPCQSHSRSFQTATAAALSVLYTGATLEPGCDISAAYPQRLGCYLTSWAIPTVPDLRTDPGPGSLRRPLRELER